MKKFKLNVQRHICILLCFILYITVLPLPVSAEEAKSKTVRVGWYEGTYNTTGADGQRRLQLRIPAGSSCAYRMEI